MNLFFTIIGAIVANTIIGAGVWAATDTEDQVYYHWYSRAPWPWVQFFTLNLWFVHLIILYYDKHRKGVDG